LTRGAALPPTAAKPGAPVDVGTLKAQANGRVDPTQLYGYLRSKFANSSLNGYVPPDGAKFGIKTGSPEEWATLGVAVAKQESDFKAGEVNTADKGGSVGLFQFGQGQKIFTKGGDQRDPQQSADAFVRSTEHYLKGPGGAWGKGNIHALSETFGSIRRPWETTQHLQFAQGIAAKAGPTSVTSGSPTELKIENARVRVNSGNADLSGMLDANVTKTQLARSGGLPSDVPVVGPNAPHNLYQKAGMQPLAENQLTTVDTPYGPVKTYPAASKDFLNFTNELKAAGAPVHSFGSYNVRKMRKGSLWSSHSYAGAFDIDDQEHLSPAMRSWIQNNPERWENILRKNNMTQPYPGNVYKQFAGRYQDAPHIEWAGLDKRAVAGGPSESEKVAMLKTKPVAPDPKSVTAALDGKALDRASTKKVDVASNGKLQVDVKAPEGTKVKAEGKGVFKKTEVSRQVASAEE
jgi:hypothetical protein